MNRNIARILSATGPIMGITMAGLLITGCEQPKPVEAIIKKPADRTAANESNDNRATARRTGFTQRTPTPTPTPVPTPGSKHDPTEPDTATHLLLLPKDFQAGGGESDGGTGWRFRDSSVLHIPERRIPFEIYRIEVEVKGKQSGAIWPEFHLALYHHALKKNVQAIPLRSNFAASEEWHVQAFDFEPPLPAGQYRLDFRMMNPHTDEATTTVRELHVRHIAFKGVKSIGQDLIPQPE